MSLTVLMEPSLLGGFRAATGEPMPLEAHADSREEALEKIKLMVRLRETRGSQIADLNDPSTHPLHRFAGQLKDDPMLDEWKQAIEDYRDQIDREEGLR